MKREQAREDATAVTDTRADLAGRIAAYYRGEIGRLMEQATHWAEHGKPRAVAHRLAKADAYFQIVNMFERHHKNGWGDSFDYLRDHVDTGRVKPLGPYPYSRELHRYNDPRFVVAELDRLDPTPSDPWDPQCDRCSARFSTSWERDEHIRREHASTRKNAAVRKEQGEAEIVLPREPTREMWALMGDVLVGYKNRHHDKVVQELYAVLVKLSRPLRHEGR